MPPAFQTIACSFRLFFFNVLCLGLVFSPFKILRRTTSFLESLGHNSSKLPTSSLHFRILVKFLYTSSGAADRDHILYNHCFTRAFIPGWSLDPHVPFILRGKARQILWDCANGDQYIECRLLETNDEEWIAMSFELLEEVKSAGEVRVKRAKTWR